MFWVSCLSHVVVVVVAVVTSVAGPSSTAGTTELETSRAAPCQPKAVRGVTWLLTPAGQRATANCPNSPGVCRIRSEYLGYRVVESKKFIFCTFSYFTD